MSRKRRVVRGDAVPLLSDEESIPLRRAGGGTPSGPPKSEVGTRPPRKLVDDITQHERQRFSKQGTETPSGPPRSRNGTKAPRKLIDDMSRNGRQRHNNQEAETPTGPPRSENGARPPRKLIDDISNMNKHRVQLPPLATSTPAQPRIAEERGFYLNLGRDPRRVVCYVCGSHVVTKVQWKPSMRTHIIAFLLCLFVYRLGRKSTHIICPSCHADVYTLAKCEITRCKCCIAVGLCCLVLWPCICVPYCTPACLDVLHYCPNCNSLIGTAN